MNDNDASTGAVPGSLQDPRAGGVRDELLRELAENLTTENAMMRELGANLIAFQERQMRTQERILRSDRFWKNVRAAALSVALLVVPVIYTVGFNNLLTPEKLDKDYVALVRVDGPISAESKASARNINSAVAKAFADEEAKGVVIAINSPGGAPVQSGLVRDYIRAKRAEHPDKTVWVVGEDYVTSGAYFMAVGADNICVNRSTMTGSIGVVMSTWGLDGLIRDVGVERRVFTAGANKNRFDPFSPLSEADERKSSELLGNLHAHFIDAVREGRGARLLAPDDVVFSGDYWTGEQAVEMGLADRLCSLEDVLESEFGVTEVKNYTAPPSLFANLSSRFGASVAAHLAQQLKVQGVPVF